VIAPDGAWDAVALGPDPIQSALTHSALQHQGCRLYAVDGEVVWGDPRQ
jgi:hypothetical protein